MNSRILAVILIIILILIPVGLAAASGQLIVEEEKPYHVGMVVNIISGYDPFNSLVLGGLFLVRSDDNYQPVLSIARSEDEFDPKFADTAKKSDLILSAGFDLTEALMKSVALNPNKKYLTIDMAMEEGEILPDNLANVIFRSNEPSYIAGYIAGMMTETRTVGFLAGMDTSIIDQFYYAYRAGVDTAAAERGEKITILKRTAGSYLDPVKGRALGLEMYSEGADIIFAAAGSSGNGVIEAAAERGAYVIGVDVDQNYLAPENVIFSVTKTIDNVIYNLVREYRNGTDYGGQVYSVGYAEGGVDVTSYLSCVPESAIARGEEFKQQIINGTLIVPNTRESYNAWGKKNVEGFVPVAETRH